MWFENFGRVYTERHTHTRVCVSVCARVSVYCPGFEVSEARYTASGPSLVSTLTPDPPVDTEGLIRQR